MIANDYTTTLPRPRKTYPQDWPAYNAAQTSEKDTLMALLADLCAGIAQPGRPPGPGRPCLPLAGHGVYGDDEGLRGLLRPPLRL